jgi:hypothetical protein
MSDPTSDGRSWPGTRMPDFPGGSPPSSSCATSTANSPRGAGPGGALLAGATEVQRDLLVYRHIHQDFSELRLRTGGGRRSVWDRVHAADDPPHGVDLLLLPAWPRGSSTLTWVYLSSATPTWEKLMSAPSSLA